MVTMKRFMLICVLFTLLGLLFPFISPAQTSSAQDLSQEAKPGQKVLRFSFWGVFKDLDFFKQVVEGFEKKNPDIKIKIEYIPGDYARKLPMLLLSNTAADILLMDDENIPAYSVRGYLEDLGPYIARDRAAMRMEEFFPTAMESFQYRGGQYGLPWDGISVLVFYNKDMFDAEGIPYPTKDWTWDDFLQIARKLTKDTNGDGRMEQIGTNMMFGFLDFQNFLWSFGGDFLNADRTANGIDNPGGLAAYQFVYDMKYKYRATVWTGEVEEMTSEVQLLTGRIGMTLAGSYFMSTLFSVKDAMRWDVALMPIGPVGKRFNRVSWDGISINKGTRYKEEAWRFLKYLVNEDPQALVGQMGRGFPVRRVDAEKYYMRPDSGVNMQLAIDAVEYGRCTPITPKFLELGTAILDLATRLNTEYSSKERNRGKITPEAAIAELAPRIDQIMVRELAKWGDNKKKNKADIPEARKYDALAFLAVPGLVALGMLIAYRFNKRFRIYFNLKFEEMVHMLKSRMARGEALYGILFASPWLLGLCIFTLFPICRSVLLSFCEWDPYDPIVNRTFVGLANYKRAFFEDSNVWIALRNTFTYAMFSVPLGITTSLSLALLLNQKIRGITIFRTVFYIPSIVSGVATAILWMYIFNPVFGPLNSGIRYVNHLLEMSYVFAFIHFPEPSWLADPNWAKPALILMSLWGAGGAGMLIFLAGLQGVPDELYEVADLDGASRLRKFWHVTLPMLTPTIYFNFIMGIIGSLQVFMQAYVMTPGGSGGPDKSLLFYVLYLYHKAFVEYDMGYACALAWILFVIILTFTMAVVKSSAVWVYYEGEKS